jgi:hypothetical protein
MKCKEIIIKYLKENNFDGLCNPEMECGCGLDDSCPCCYGIDECEPAYLVKCVCECEIKDIYLACYANIKTDKCIKDGEVT